MSYTGIAEIDKVLLDLYGEQTLIEKALQLKPKSKVLVARRARVRVLADKLLLLGQILQRISGVARENA